jgi:hypothetical protein
MSEVVCPRCEVVVPAAEVAAGWCDACGKRIPAYALNSAGAELSRRQPGVTNRGPHPSADRHTARCDALLPPEYRGRFPVLARVMEKASILWALLSPLVWSLLNKHYVVGYDAADRSLVLFRLPLGLFGPGQAREVQKYPLRELEALEYRGGLLTARLKLRTTDGARANLFAPMPSKRNTRAVYEATRQA